MISFDTVKLGSSGRSVYILQSLLRAMQYTDQDNRPIDITGSCDSRLVYAINTFQTIQRAYGVECGTNGKNDGSFGPACWRRMLGV